MHYHALHLVSDIHLKSFEYLACITLQILHRSIGSNVLAGAAPLGSIEAGALDSEPAGVIEAMSAVKLRSAKLGGMTIAGISTPALPGAGTTFGPEPESPKLLWFGAGTT